MYSANLLGGSETFGKKATPENTHPHIGAHLASSMTLPFPRAVTGNPVHNANAIHLAQWYRQMISIGSLYDIGSAILLGQRFGTAIFYML